jgi:hypothetical protein
MATFTLPTSKNIWNFDPTSIGGCTLWLDGADSNTIVTTVGGSTPAVPGGSVAQWRDKSIMANHASQATAGNQPIRDATNGLAFTGSSSQFLQLANAGATYLPTGATNGTYFTVSAINRDATIACPIISHGTTGDSRSRTVYDRISVSSTSFTTLMGSLITEGTNINGPNPFSSNQFGVPAVVSPHIITLNVNNLIASVWISGTPATTTNIDIQNTTTVVDTATTTAYIGRNLPAGAFGYYYGKIYEVLVFNTTLSNIDRQIIEGYLAYKWNLIDSLPTTHPYYNNKIRHSFIPPAMSYCSLWLDAADRSTTYKESTFATLAGQSDRVGGWLDKSGFGNYAYNSTPDAELTKPILISNVLRFSGNSFMVIPNNRIITLPIETNAGTYFVVSKTTQATEATTPQVVFSYGTTELNPNNTGFRQMFYRDGLTLDPPAPGLKSFAFDTFQSNRVSDTTDLRDQLSMVSATQNTTTTAGWLNGNPFSDGTTPTSSTLQVGKITSEERFGFIGAGVNDSDATAFYLTGDIGEILVFNAVLPTNQRENIEGYLAWKWGLQALLPTTHSYTLANYFYNNTRPFLRNFVPTDISNCVMWFDGADLTSMFTNTLGTTQVSGTGSLVRFWRDKSNSGNNLISDAPTNSPTITTSSNPRGFDLIFDGDDYLSNTNVANNSNTYTKIFVFRRNDTGVSTNQYQRVFSYGSTTGDFSASDPTGFHFQSANTQTAYLGYKSNTGTGNVTLALNTYHIVTIVASPLTMSIFTNGSLTATLTLTLSNVNTNFNGTTFRLGTNFSVLSNGGWPGAINEVISYNRQLSVTEYRQVEGYLAWKWGLRSSLPATHPFSKFPTPSLTPLQPELQLYKNTFDPSDLSPDIWFDAQDRSMMGVDTNGRIVQWKNKGSATSCGFLSIPSYASRSLNATETNSNALTVSGPLLSTTTSINTPTSDYLDFSTGSYPITTASVSGTTMTITLGAPTTVNVTGGSIAAFSLSTLRGTNTSTLATIYFTEQLVPPFSVGSQIVVAGTVNSSATVLNETWTVVSCTPFYVTFTLVGATIGSLTTQGTIRSSTLVNIATVNYTTTASKQPFIAGQTIATISGMTPAGLNGTTPTLLTAGPNQFQFLTSVATGTISSAGTITNAVVPHNIPSGRQIAVGFANGSTFFGASTSTNPYFLIDSLDKLTQYFSGRGTYYIVASVPAPNTLTITVPSGLPDGAVNILAGRVDYGEILSSNAGAALALVSAPYANSTAGVNNANTLSSSGNTSTSATVTFTPSSRYYNQSFIAGDTINISGVTNPTTYNGTWYVTAGTSTSVTFETTTTLANMVSTAGTLSRVQNIMPSGCHGIISISVSGTTATVTYNNFGVAINGTTNGIPHANGNPFEINHAIYIAGTTATGGSSSDIFNGTFTVTRESIDVGRTGTVQFTIAGQAGASATIGIICRGSGGTAGLSGAFPTTSCTINSTNAVVNFARQPIIPFVVGQQIRIASTVSSGTNINGLRTVTAATPGSVTFDIASGTGSITTQGTISAGMVNVSVGGSYSSPNLTLNLTQTLSSPFPVGTWVVVYGVVPVANNGYWQVTGGNTTSVQLSVPGGSGPITNTTGTVSYALQMSCGTMTQHGLSPGDVVFISGSQYAFVTAGANYPGVSSIPYTIIETPSAYRYTILPRSNYYQPVSVQGFSTSVGPVYSNESPVVTFFPIVGYCLENTRSQASSGIFNSTNATMLYMSHFYTNAAKSTENGQGTLFSTSTTVNGNSANSLASLGIQYLFSSAPRYNLFRNGQRMRGPNSDSYYQTDTFLGSNLNSFRPAVIACNFTPNTVNDMTPQTLAFSLLGTRLENTFRSSPNNGNVAIQVSNQTGTVVNATWLSNVATLTLILNSNNYFFVGNSITVQNIVPSGFNGTFTVTGSTTGATSGALTYTGWTVNTITYALASNPVAAYTAGTGRVLLNTTTSLSTNHFRIGAATQATNAFDINSFMNMSNYYSQGIGDIIAFNRILTTEERQLLEGWVSQKYNSQLYLAQNQSAVKSDTTFRVTQASYTGSGPYVNTITFTSTANNQFSFNAPITITGCTEATTLNGTWAVTNSSNTTATFFSPTIILPSTPLTITSVTNVTGITVANTFIHPYRLNPVGISPSLDLTKTYTQGLATWFDAANSSTIGFSSGNLVRSWTSAGGNISALTLTQATIANQPTLDQNVQNGLPGIKFIRGTISGSTYPNSSNLTTATSFNMNQFTTISSNNDHTNFAVVKFTIDPTINQTVIIITNGSARPYLLKGGNIEYFNGTPNSVLYSPTLSINVPYIITAYRRGTKRGAIILGNGNRVIIESTFTNQIMNVTTRLSIGGFSTTPSANNDPFEGYIHEFAAFRYALTDQAIYQIEGYLAWKWGLQRSLPTTHPYYKVRP